MTMKLIEIVIGPAGETQLQTQGFQGRDCKVASAKPVSKFQVANRHSWSRQSWAISRWASSCSCDSIQRPVKQAWISSVNRCCKVMDIG